MPAARADRWIAVTEEAAISRYLRYPHERWPNNLIATVSRAEGLRHSILSGAGVGVLPCFVGDDDPELCRVGEEFAPGAQTVPQRVPKAPRASTPRSGSAARSPQRAVRRGVGRKRGRMEFIRPSFFREEGNQ